MRSIATYLAISTWTCTAEAHSAAGNHGNDIRGSLGSNTGAHGSAVLESVPAMVRLVSVYQTLWVGDRQSATGVLRTS